MSSAPVSALALGQHPLERYKASEELEALTGYLTIWMRDVAVARDGFKFHVAKLALEDL